MTWEDREPITNVQRADVNTAAELVKTYQRASFSFLQRRMRIGYRYADMLMTELELRGAVGPVNGDQPRKVYLQ